MMATTAPSAAMTNFPIGRRSDGGLPAQRDPRAAVRTWRRARERTPGDGGCREAYAAMINIGLREDDATTVISLLKPRWQSERPHSSKKCQVKSEHIYEQHNMHMGYRDVCTKRITGASTHHNTNS